MNLNILRINDNQLNNAKASSRHLLQQSGLSKEDASALVDYLLKSIPSLKSYYRPFIQGIVRWYVDGDIDLTPESLSRVNTLLRNFFTSPAYDAFDRNFGTSDFGPYTLYTFDDLVNLLEIDVSEAPSSALNTNHTYSLVRVHSHEELLSYAPYISRWCITSSEEVFNDYTFNGLSKLYLLLRDDYKQVRPTPGEDYPKDDYGLSIISVIVDSNYKIASITSRWNSSEESDSFLTDSELESLIGENLMDDIYSTV